MAFQERGVYSSCTSRAIYSPLSLHANHYRKNNTGIQLSISEAIFHNENGKWSYHFGTKNMKPWHRRIGTLSGLLLTGYFLYFAFKTYDVHNLSALLRTKSLLAVTGAALIIALIIPLSGLAWSILLSSISCYWKTKRLITILGFTQLAKYVPGNVAQQIGRTTVALVGGMPPSAFISSVLTETILIIAASLFVGFLSMTLSPIPIPLSVIQLPDTPLFLAAILALSALLLILLFKNAPSIIRHLPRPKKWQKLTLPIPGTRAIGLAFGLYCIAYLLLGLALWLIATCQGGLPNADIFTFTASFTLAWLAGYLALGAPAGLGVREGAMLVLLSNAGPSEHVLTIIIAARLATILSDAFVFALSVYSMRSSKGKTQI
ncbi:MAG: lysylphosphatidylglycerol synthase domain-containing protein [Sulfuricaulis sp.]